MRSAAWAMLGLWVAGSAQAQVSVTIDAPDVMVVPIQPQGSSLKSEARRLDEQFVAVVGENNVLTDISTVPHFDAEGYDATTYVDSCPAGQYAGCMLVVAQRVEMDWAIGGTLAPAPELGGGESQLTVHVIDVSGSREVMAFGVVVGGGTDDSSVLRQVTGVFNNLVAGLADEVDVRGDLEDPAAQAAFEARRQKLIAASLAQLESELGEVIREDVALGRLDSPKLTRKDLADYSDRDDAAPWERLHMTQAQFIRMQNRGIDLVDYRMRLRGRLGQILLRVGVGGGSGPWGLHHEGRWLVDFNETTGQFYDAAIRQYQESRSSSSSSFQIELGFGVLPWIELSGVYGLRNAPFTYRFKQDNASDPVAIPGSITQTPGRTSELGGRIEFIPMPTYQVRPTLHMGLFSWKGAAIVPGQEPMIAFDAPKATYMEIGPGGELSAGPYLNVFLRGHANVLLSGSFSDEIQQGEVTRLQNFDEPFGPPAGGGWGIQGGLQLRIGVLKKPEGSSIGIMSDGLDEEPDL